MKIPPKNIAIGILAAAALAFVGYTVMAPFLKGRRGSRTGAARPAAAAPAVPAAAAAKGAAALAAAGTNGLAVPTAPIDVVFVRANLARWIESPSRDPFAMHVAPLPKGIIPRAVDLLTLKAIWSQTGGRLAVINSSIVREGESVSGFEIEAIESRSVRVRGSNGVEQIEFLAGRPRPTRATNAPGTSPRPDGAGSSRDRTLSP